MKINTSQTNMSQNNPVVISQEEVHQAEVHQEKISQEKVHQDQVHREEVLQHQIRQDRVLQAEVLKEEVLQDQIHQKEILQDQIHQREVLQDRIHQREIHQREISQELNQLGVGTFLTYETTEIALGELKDNGFLMDRVSLIGRDINNHTEVTGVRTSNQLIEFDNLDINENQTGQTAIDGAMASTTIGDFAVLIDRVANGDYLVMVQGSNADLTLAESIFSKHGINEWYIHDLLSDSVQTLTTTSENFY